MFVVRTVILNSNHSPHLEMESFNITTMPINYTSKPRRLNRPICTRRGRALYVLTRQ